MFLNQIFIFRQLPAGQTCAFASHVSVNDEPEELVTRIQPVGTVRCSSRSRRRWIIHLSECCF